jgi:hypothetical protein
MGQHNIMKPPHDIMITKHNVTTSLLDTAKVDMHNIMALRHNIIKGQHNIMMTRLYIMKSQHNIMNL